MGTESLSRSQLELLVRLTRQLVDSRMEELCAPLVGPLESNITRFIQDGLLEEASLAKKFAWKYGVTDLKRLSKQHGIKPKGNKPDLINALLEVLPINEATELVADIKAYSLTPLGQRLADAFLEEKQQGRIAMESGAFACLLKGEIEKAGEIIAQYEAQQLFPRGLGSDWSDGMPEAYLEQASYLAKYLYDDLPLNEQQRQEIGAQLALSLLLGEPFRDATNRVLQVTGGKFACASLEEFLRTNSRCAYGVDLENPKDLAALYIQTRVREASQRTRLKQLLRSRESSVIKGVEIRPMEDSCEICNRGKRQYDWAEVEDIPKVPRHWGCGCYYAAWMQK
jgi:hypothetical protein